MMREWASVLRRLRNGPTSLSMRLFRRASRNPAVVSISVVFALVAQVALTATIGPTEPATAAVSTTSCGAFGTGTDLGDIVVKPLHGKAFYTDLKNGINATYVGYEIVNQTASNLDNIWVQIDDFRAVTGASVLSLANSADSALPVTPADPSTQPVGRIPANASSFVYFLVKASDVTSNPQRHDIHIFRGDPKNDGSEYGANYDCYYELSGVKRTLAASANKVTQITADNQATLGGTVTVTVKGATGTAGAGDSTLDGDSMWLSPASMSTWPTRALRLESVNLVVKYKKNDPSNQWVTTNNSLLVKNIACSVSGGGCKSFTSGTTYTATYKFRVTGSSTTNAEVMPVAQIASGTQMKHTGGYPATITMVPTTTVSQNIKVEKIVDPTYTITHSGGFFNIRYQVKLTNSDTADAVVDEVLDAPASGVTLAAGTVRVKDKYRLTETALNPEPTSKDDLGRYHFGGPFTVAGSGTAYVYYVMKVPDPTTYPSTTDNVAYGLVGPTLIDASLSTNNVTDCTVTLNANGTTTNSCNLVTPQKTNQVITFNQPPAQGAGTSYILDATSDSGLDVSYRIVSGPCAISGTTVIYQAQGNCLVEASQPGDDTYNAATPVQRTVAILPQQVITFPQPNALTTSSSQDVTITSSSGLKVTLTSLDTSICKVGSTTSTPADTYTPASTATNVFRITSYTSAGNCPLVASQPGDGVLYGAATSVDRTVPVGLSTQVLTTEPTAPPATQSTSTGTVAWNVSPRIGTSSGALLDLPVTFTSQTPSVCTAGDAIRTTSGGSTYAYYASTITWTQPGLCVVQASQDGLNASGVQSAYGSADPITISFSIGATPVVTIQSVSAVKSSESFNVTVIVTKPAGATGAPKGTLNLYTSGDHVSNALQSGSPLVTNVTGDSNKYVFTVDASALPATSNSGSISLFATYTSVGAVTGETTYNNSQTVNSSTVTIYSPASVLISPSKPTVLVNESYTATVTVIGNSNYGTPSGTITLTTADGGTVTSTMPATLNASGQFVVNLLAGSDPAKNMILDASYSPSGASATYFNSQSSSVTAVANRTVEIDPRTYTATFDAHGGSGTMPAQSSNRATTFTVNTFARPGYSFTGWNTLADGTGTPYGDGSSYNFLADISLFAQWTALPTYRVHFDANGGSGTMTDQVNYQATALTANAFSYRGKVFVGWNSLADGTGTTYSDSTQYAFTADLALFAQWTDLPTYTVHFHANGGSGTMTDQINYEPAALTGNSFTRAGYAFAGWTTGSDGTGTAFSNGAQYAFTSSTTLFAQWTLLPRYTVTFDPNLGSGSMLPQSNYAQAPLMANTFSRLGYTFAGWNTRTDGLGTSYTNGAQYEFQADVQLFAQWTQVPFHTVVFDANLGSGAMESQVGNYAQALSVNSFSRDGYTFLGWNTQSDGLGTDFGNGAVYAFSSDTTLFAKWNPLPTYSVSFDPNGGSGSMEVQTAYSPGPLIANTFSRTNYEFTGWNSAPDGTGTSYVDGQTYGFARDIVLFAQWQRPMHSVIFDANLGQGVMSNQVNNAAHSLSPNSFFKLGYSFAGWNTSANGTGLDYTDEQSYSFVSDMTLYAQWIPDDYTVIYDPQGGSVVPTSTGFTVGSSPLALPLPLRPGYEFTGWSEQSIALFGIVGVDGAHYSPSGDVTLFAQWVPNVYTVVFDPQLGTVAPGSVDFTVGDSPLDPPVPSRDGYTFVGWNTVPDGSGSVVGDGFTPDADVTLFAQWVPDVYTVVYDAEGGAVEPGSVDFTVGDSPLNQPVPSRDGYTFVGWNTVSDGSGSVVGDGFTPDADVTLFAQWQLIVFTVHFEANGGVGSMTDQTDHVSAALASALFVRDGYTFGGWNTVSDGSGVGYSENGEYPFDADVTLFAQWIPDVFTVTYDAQSGSVSPGSVDFTVGDSPLNQPVPSRDGYTFVGWNTVSDGSGSVVGDGFTPDADVTLFAQWQLIVFTVHFEANGGVGSMADQTDHVSAALASTLFTRTGYTFGGWNTVSDGSGVGYSENGEYPFDADVTLFAQWVPDVYTVVYDAEGGAVEPGSVDFTVGDSPLELPRPSKEGFTFGGWSLNPETLDVLIGFDGDNYTPEESTTLYAIWQPTLFSQNLDGNVWLDLDADGLQSPDEPNLPGLTLEIGPVTQAAPFPEVANAGALPALAGVGDLLGNFVSTLERTVASWTVVTSADGSYHVGPLSIGDWVILAILPSKLTPTAESDSGADGQLFLNVAPGEDSSSWMGVRGRALIESPVYGSDGKATNSEVILQWEGIDETILSEDDVQFRTDPVSGVIEISGLPSGNYRLIRVGSTPSDSECAEITLMDNVTFTAPIITQKGYDCHPESSGELANTGVSTELSDAWRWGSIGILFVLVPILRASHKRRRQSSL